MRSLVLIACMFAAAATPAAAEPQTVFTPASQSKLVLDGSSNVTDWQCSGTSLDGELTVAAPIEKINAVIDRIEDGNIGVWMNDPSQGRFPAPNFRLRVPIESLRCGNAVMERDMNRALKADDHPAIEFRFIGVQGGIEHDIDSNVYRAKIAGELVLAGSRRNIELTIVAERIGGNRFRIRADMPLRMTDFGITPPTALFGMVRARNELMVRFDMTLQVRS
ncbi:MAG TPA: YceI family protein [Thermoanaerobaculia bacterium]|nr:YceI family protein [Thermoanaerobaculia bacterium]